VNQRAAHESGFLFLVAGSVSESQKSVVAVKAVDTVDTQIEAIAILLRSFARRRAISCRMSLREV
jgi:hypothetical protein